MEVALRAAWLYVNGSNVTIRGLQMRHSSTLGIVNWPACNLNGNDNLLESLQVTWGDFVGVACIAGMRSRVINCTIACHGNAGMGGAGESHTVDPVSSSL